MFKLLIFLIILMTWNFILIIKNNKKNKKNYTQAEKITEFILGNSHTYYAFKSDINKNRINLSEISQTLYYDLKILKNNEPLISNCKVCYLNLSYFSLCSNEIWQKDDIIKYFWILPFREFTGENRLKYIVYRFFPILISLIKRLKKLKKLKAHNFEKRLKKHVEILEKNIFLEKNIEMLTEIIKICKNKKIRVVLITTPYTKKYCSYFSEELLEKNLYSPISNLKKDFNVVYKDFSNLEGFDKNIYFDDFDHLSLEGSIKFLEELDKVKATVSKNYHN